MPVICKDKNSCFGCGACEAICPKGAITMRRDDEGFLYPLIDEDECSDCGMCKGVCPANSDIGSCDFSFHMLRCNDEELLSQSSSGGAFSLLADAVIQKGGLVAGAVFNDELEVVHILGKTIDGMRGSKYVQSRTGTIFRDIKNALDEDIPVLFSGTPCQCHGLLSYLGGNRRGLILVSLICRGVASPGLWQDYLHLLEARSGKVTGFCFRDKSAADNGHTVSYLRSGRTEKVSMDKDAFTVMYLKCLSLRSSCYNCPYTRCDLPFDISIGDLWGTDCPEYRDGKGLSLVITRTCEGNALLDLCRDKAVIRPIDGNAPLQPSLQAPAPKSLLRKLLFKDYRSLIEKEEDITLLLDKYGRYKAP